MIAYRDAVAVDAPALAALCRDTFVATFAHLYPPENLVAYLAEAYSVEAIAAEINEAGSEIRLACDGDTLVGYCKIGAFKLPFDTGGRRALELHRLYVVERVKGAGVAAALMDWALARLHERGAQDVYLGVYQENYRAQNFYKRYGFEIVGEYLYPPIGPEPDKEFIMRAALD